MKIKHIIIAASFSLGMSVISFAQSIEQGLKFMDIEQYGNARKNFESLVQSTPNADHFFYLGNLQLTLDEVDLATASFEKGLNADPKNPLPPIGKGAIEVLKKNDAEAKKFFESAIALSKGKNPEVYALIAKVWIDEKRELDLAISYLDKATLMDKKNHSYFLLLGDAYLLKNNGTEATRNFEKAIALNPKLAKAHIKQGKVWVRARNYNEALKYYKTGVEADPTYSPGYRELGELYFLAKQYDNALSNYKKYMEMSDGNADSKFRYASFLFQNKKYAEALEILNQLAPTQQNNYVLWRLLAYSAYETDKATEGLQHIQKYFSIVKPEKILALDYIYQGRLEMKTGNDSVGVDHMMKGYQMDSISNQEVPLEIAKTYNEKKQYLKAAKFYEKVFASKTPNANDLLTLGKAYYFGKDYVKADTVFNKLIVAKPELHFGYLYRARCNSYLDEANKPMKGWAKPFYEKSIEIQSKDVEKNKKDLIEAYSYLGSYYLLGAKDNAKAKESFKKVLEFDPNDKRATEILKVVK